MPQGLSQAFFLVLNPLLGSDPKLLLDDSIQLAVLADGRPGQGRQPEDHEHHEGVENHDYHSRPPLSVRCSSASAARSSTSQAHAPT